MKDYFDIRRDFFRNKNIDASYRLEEDFKKALNNRKLCSALLDDNKKLEKFKNKMGNLFHRINSMGFVLNQMKNEERDWENFMKDAYHPYRTQGGFIPSSVTGVEEPITIEFAFESFLFFVDATLEYLSQVIGLIFRNPNVKELVKLKNILKNNYENNILAEEIVKIIDNGKHLWEEMQEEGVRDVFENIEPYVDKYEGKSLRDIISHYREIRISPIQMTISKNGIISAWTLKAGSMKIKIDKPKWGDQSAGLVHKTEAYLENLMNWIESILKLFYGEKSTSF